MKKILLFSSFSLFYLGLSSQQTVFMTEATGSPFLIHPNQSVIGFATADLNADGKQDVIVGNDSGRPLAVYLGDGSGQFTQGPLISFSVSSQQPVSNTIADFNNDGIPDIASADQSFSKVIVFLGTGTGAFTPKPAISLPGFHEPTCIDSRDFNLDGKMDFIVVCETDNIGYIYLGAGNGTFTATTASPFSIGSKPSYVQTGFFNADAFPDFAIVNQTANSVGVFLGTGTGTFSPAPGSPITVGSSPRTLSVKDINNDGKTDIVVPNYSSSSISILLGQGNGSFTNAPGSPVSLGNFNALHTAIADFDLDGIQDIAVTQPSGNIITFLVGPNYDYATGSTIISIGSPPEFFCTNDFNGDGFADLFCGILNGNMMKVYLNTNPVGIKEYDGNTNVAVYPNPASNQLTIKLDDFKPGMDLTIYDVLGQTIDKIPLTGKETFYRNTHCAKGVYTFKITLNNQPVKSGRILFE